MRSLVAICVALVLIVGCKPENEPDWPYGPPPGGFPDVGRPAPLTPTPGGGADVVGGDAAASPTSPGGEPDVDSSGSDVLLAGDATATDVAGEGGLSPEVVTELRRPVTASDREAAERAAARGGKLLQRMQLREAEAQLRRALERMPAHVPANYRLARVLAVLGDVPGSLERLLVLDFLDTEPAKARLVDARAEPDFRPLWQQEDYRRLTGFGTIGVTIRTTENSGEAAAEGTRRRVVTRLHDAGLPVVVAAPALPPGKKAAVVLHAKGHGELAAQVASALAGEMPVRLAREKLGVDVLVVWDARRSLADAGGAVPEVTLDNLFDRRLHARDGYGLRHVLLRSTGFFEAEDRSKSGDEVRRRRGRYEVKADQIVFQFKETTERYSAESDLPEIGMKEGTKSVPFSVGPGRQIVLDGLAYRESLPK